MAVQIPNLPAIAAAAGTDLYETVQSGVSSKVSLSQIVTYVQSQTGTGVTGLSFGTTGLLPNSVTGGTITVTGTLVAANGGTGISSYAVGDILVASGAAALSKLAVGAVSLPLVSTGTTVGYSILTVPGGGTGAATLTNHGVLLGQGTGALAATAVGATGTVLTGNTGADPTFQAVSSIAVSTISFGTTGLTPSVATAGAITVAGTLVVANGGSGLATRTAHSIQVGNGTGNVTQLTVGTTGQILTGSTGADPAWAAATSVAVTSINFGTTGLTPSSVTQGAITVAGTLVAANGGTGFASYAIGDLLYADSTTTLAKLADVATGRVLVSGGIGVAPAWSATPSLTSLALGGATIGANAFAVTGHVLIEGVTSTGATGTGNLVFATAPTVTTLTVSSGGAAITGNTSVSSGTFTASGGAFTASPASANVVLSPTGTGVVTINPATAGTMNNVVIGGSTPLAGTFTTLSDTVGNVRSIIHSGSDKTSTYSLLATDNGQYVSLGASGAITIPNSTFADGNVVTIFNNTASSATITVNTTTGYIAGTNTNKGGGGTMTLATRGVCTILFLGATSCVVSGNVS